MTDDFAPPRHLCVCADDFGLGAGINDAVLDLIARRQLGAAACLVQRGAWPAGVKALRRVDAARADVGLQLDLAPPTLPHGPEPGLAPLIALAWSRTASRVQLAEQIRAQLSRFEDGMGRAPDFVAGHRHVHQFPVVRDLLVNALVKRYPASALPWLRGTAPRFGVGGHARLIHALGGPALERLAARHEIPMSGALLGICDFEGSASDYRRRLFRWLAAARTGDVLVCRPSLDTRPGDPHAAARHHAYAVLGEIDFERHAVAVVPHSRLLRVDPLAVSSGVGSRPEPTRHLAGR